MNGSVWTGPVPMLKFRTMHAKYCRGAEYGGDEAEREFERVLQHPSARTEFETNSSCGTTLAYLDLGAFSRRTSLDELPQLVNVLRGS